MDRDPYEHRPMLTDADRLLLVVRRMNAEEFAQVFRAGLSAQALMGVVTALPTDRLNLLMDRTRTATVPASRPQQRQHGPRGRVARAIRAARKRARMTQMELADLVGVRQSSVSQWERGVTEPSTQNLLDLLRVLPVLSDLLNADRANGPGVAAQATPGSGPLPASDSGG